MLHYEKIVRQRTLEQIMVGYFAAEVGGSITGRGADLLIIDDPHTEQDSMSEHAMDRAYDWY